MTLRPGRRTWHRVVAAARAGLLATVAVRFARGRNAPAPLAPGGHGEVPADVTVVVPARDEADRIEPCIRSLVPQVQRVLVVDDGSTDDTAAIATAAGATVIDAGDLPAGWAGKAHALQVGIEAADTPAVVCVDADTRARPGFVGAVVEAADGSTLLTAGARADVDDAGERWLHPALLASIVYRYGIPGTPHRTSRRLLANGQCMVVDREAFLAAGGFSAVRNHLVEDVAVARWLHERGHEVRFRDAADLLTVAGYGSLAAAWRGWGRSLDLAEVTPASTQLFDLATLWSVAALPSIRLLTGRGDLVDVVGIVMRLGVTAGTRRAYSTNSWLHWVSPLADAAVAARLTWGTVRPSRTWRGRTYA